MTGDASATITHQVPSDEEVREDFKNLTGAFMTRRMDRMLENDPDASRMKNRMSGREQAGLVANLEGTGSSLDGALLDERPGDQVADLAA